MTADCLPKYEDPEGDGTHACAPIIAATARWARRLLPTLVLSFVAPAWSATVHYDAPAQRIHIKGGGLTTLSAVRAAVPEAALQLVNRQRKIWLLRADVLIEDGTVLRLYGERVGGDVNELRLRSDNAPGPRPFVSITADHGHLDIRSTRITSWDTAAQAPDIEIGRYGRAFLRARSRLVLNGTRAAESRMDLIESELAYLGFGAPESYGLVWKVSATEAYVFDRVQVRGDVIKSHIHHNYFGLYSYGGQSGMWRDNDIHSNAYHGIDLQSHSDRMLIRGNKVYRNGGNGLNIAKHCDHFVIRDNHFSSNGRSGIMLFAGASHGLIESNRSDRNTDSGLSVLATDGTVIRRNTLVENGRAGIQLGMGVADALIEGNEIGNNGRFGLYLHKGGEQQRAASGLPPRRNTFRHNKVYGSGIEAIRLSASDHNLFLENQIYDNGLPTAYRR